MGNALSCKCVGSPEKQVKVLLPDGEVVLADGPILVAELMIEHPNHMIVHCSTADPRALGKRLSMTIMQADQELEPGEAYLVHPVPPQYQNAMSRSPVSLSKDHLANLSGKKSSPKSKSKSKENGKERRKLPIALLRQRSKRIVAHIMPKARGKVGDSSGEVEGDETKEALLEDDGRRKGGAAASPVKPPTSAGAEADKEEEEEDDSVNLRVNYNLNMYLSWKPALSSIPESPLGSGYFDLPKSFQVKAF